MIKGGIKGKMKTLCRVRQEPKQTPPGTVHSLVDRNGTNCTNEFEERENASENNEAKQLRTYSADDSLPFFCTKLHTNLTFLQFFIYELVMNNK